MSGPGFRGFVAATLAVLSVLSLAAAARAAEIVARPDLADTFRALRPLYHDGARFTPSGPLLPEKTAQGTGWAAPPVFVELRGPIEPGDAAALERTLWGPDLANIPFRPTYVVLDSPGGSFAEGLRIGEVLRRGREGNGGPILQAVLVAEGGECLSACAVAFALAAVPADAGSSARYVEVGARLGFHMPYLSDGVATQEIAVGDAMDLTYDVVAEYVRMIANGIAPTALIENALRYRGADAFFLLEGGVLTRFMDFVPVGRGALAAPLAVAGLTKGHALTMCQYLAFSAGRRMTPGEYEFWRLDTSSHAFDDATPLAEMFGAIGSRRIAIDRCALEWRDDDTLGIALGSPGRSCPASALPGDHDSWCPVPAGDPLPQATTAQLADVLDCHGGRLTLDYYDWDPFNRFLEEETAEPESWQRPQRLDWQRALTETVTAMTAPGTAGAVLGTVAAGTTFAVSDCALVADGTGVWLQIETSAGPGWIPGRAVAPPADRETYRAVIRPVGWQ